MQRRRTKKFIVFTRTQNTKIFVERWSDQTFSLSLKDRRVIKKMDLIKIWYRKYQKEPHWLDNWDSQLDRPKRLIVRDRHGNAVAREATVKLRRTRKTWGLPDYCKYCTDFLTERTDEDAEDPCIKCGIRDTIREEQEQYTEIFLAIEENFHKRGD
jgi:hypothetical protein